MLIQNDHPFPGAVPQQEGVVWDLFLDGATTIFFQFPGLTPAERQAFAAGPRRISLYVASRKTLIVPWLVFRHTPPLGWSDCTMIAPVYPDDRLERFLEKGEGGRPKNLCHLILLDGAMVREQRVIGLADNLVLAVQAVVLQQEMAATGSLASQAYKAACAKLIAEEQAKHSAQAMEQLAQVHQDF